MRCVISGNFSGRMEEFLGIYDVFEKSGVEVLSPPRQLVDIFSADFLNRQNRNVFRTMQDLRFLDLLNSDFLYVLMPPFQRDEKTEMEMGAAAALKVPVFVSEKYEDITMNLYAIYVPPKELVKDISGYQRI